MGTRGIFQVYDSSSNTYTYYYIHGDSLIVLKEIRKKLKTCGSIKSIRKTIDKEIANRTIRANQLGESGDNPYTVAQCWPFLEYSLIIKIFSDGWEIHPIHECMEKEFKLAKYQRSDVFYRHSNV